MPSNTALDHVTPRNLCLLPVAQVSQSDVELSLSLSNQVERSNSPIVAPIVTNSCKGKAASPSEGSRSLLETPRHSLRSGGECGQEQQFGQSGDDVAACAHVRHTSIG